MTTFFVTGATGFIGSHVCRRLVADGHEVSALVRSPAKAAASLPKEVRIVEGDLASLRSKDFALPESDIVIHLAGVIAARRMSEYHRWNYEAVVDLVHCIERQSWKPRRFLFASSLAAAGPTVLSAPKKETDLSEPIEAYGEAKLQAEAYLQRAPFPTTSFRPSLVLGPRDPATLTFFRMGLYGIGFRVACSDVGISHVYIDDLVDAIVRMSNDTGSVHHTYFVSHPDPVAASALWKAIGATLGKRVHVLPIPKWALYLAMVAASSAARLFRFINQLDKKQYLQITAPGFVCSSAALSADLGWPATHDLRASLESAYAGYKQDGWL